MKHDALIPRLLPLTAAVSTLALGACVTINIYFPAAAAEKAADRIIEEVYQMKGGEAARPPGAPAPATPASPTEKK